MTILDYLEEIWKWFYRFWRVETTWGSVRYKGKIGPYKMPKNMMFLKACHAGEDYKRILDYEIRNEGCNSIIVIGGLQHGLKIYPGAAEPISAGTFELLVDCHCIEYIPITEGCHFLTDSSGVALPQDDCMWVRYRYILNC